jgi:hypothetical protein
VTAWWYRTRWWWYTNWVTITRHPGPQREFEVEGYADWDWDDGNLWTTNTLVRILGHFGVSPNRTPSRGRYRSSPTLDLAGSVAVSTGYAKRFAFIKTNQPSAWVSLSYTQHLTNGPVDKTDSGGQMLVDLNDNDLDYEKGFFGDRGFPSIEFYMHPNSPVHVNLEIKIRYFVEGDAEVDIGAPTSLYMSMPQWEIAPA